jgi:hypothetical protein
MAGLSACNSLAEIGIGVNLAFGLIKGVQATITELFSEKITEKSKSLQATLIDMTNTEADALKFMLTLDEKITAIRNSVQYSIAGITKRSIKYAISVSFLLLIFLLLTSIYPELQIKYISIFVFLFIISPICYTYIHQFSEYIKGRIQLGKIEKEINTLHGLTNSYHIKIAPHNP